MGLKDIYLNLVGGFLYWIIKIFLPTKHRDVTIGWLALRFGIFEQEEFNQWMEKKIGVEK